VVKWRDGIIFVRWPGRLQVVPAPCSPVAGESKRESPAFGFGRAPKAPAFSTERLRAGACRGDAGSFLLPRSWKELHPWQPVGCTVMSGRHVRSAFLLGGVHLLW